MRTSVSRPWLGGSAPTNLLTRWKGGSASRHPVYHHGLAESIANGVAAWGSLRYPMNTNSLGFRDREPREVPLARDGRRILFIGDSFTEGIGLAYEDSFVGILSEAGKEHGTEVLNAGAVSYAPSIYWSKLRVLLNRGLEVDEVVVMLDLSDVYDESVRYRMVDGRVFDATEPGVEDVLKEFVREHTILCNALACLLRSLREGETEPHRRFGLPQSMWPHDPDAMRSFGRQGLDLATRYTTGLCEMLAERSIALTLVVYPWPDQIRRREGECLQVTHWREWARKCGVVFIDLLAPFIEEGAAEDVLERYYIPGDVHWNESGHAFVARLLRERNLP